jgi:hypothetical protein
MENDSALAATAVTKAQYELRAEFKAGTSGDAIKRARSRSKA